VIARTVTYYNAGNTPVTLTAAADMTGPDGKDAPTGMFTLSATAIVVPAGGQTAITLTADTRVAGPDGQYIGRVVATGGDIYVGTPVAVEREAESYDLAVSAIGRDGKPPSFFSATVHPGGDLIDEDGDGTAAIRLPRGEYAVTSIIDTGAESPTSSSTLLAAPRVSLTGDRKLMLDARAAKPVEVSAPRTTASLAIGYVAATVIADDQGYTDGIITRGGYQGIYTGQVGPSGDSRRFNSFVYGEWLEPGEFGDFVDSPYVYHLTWFRPGGVFDGLIRHPREQDLATVRVRHLSPPGRVGEEGTHAAPIDAAPGEDERMITPAGFFRFQLPMTRTEFYTTDGLQWLTPFTQYRAADGQPELTGGATWRTYRRDTYQERWGVGVFGPSVPKPDFPGRWVRQYADALVVRVPVFTDGMPGHFGFLASDSAHTTLYRDGQRVVESNQAGSVTYRAPSVSVSYRVDTELTQSSYDTSTRITASWCFRSMPVTGTGSVSLPVMAVRFIPKLDDTSRAPAGVFYPIPISVERQPGAPTANLASLRVEVSYDDGQVWQPVALAATPSGWNAQLHHPAKGYVSLRAYAADAEGNSVKQTIIRAYGLRNG
jgi:hypothetical protein